MTSLSIFFSLILTIGEAKPETLVDNRDRLVGILGDSISDDHETNPINEDALAALFGILRSYQPDAVFFTGNLIGISKTARHPMQIFVKQLERFVALEKNELGFNIPFYPVMGNQDASIERSAQLFRVNFNLNSIPGIEPNQLVYTVAIGDAFFAVIATDYYDPISGKKIEHQITPAVLTWLDRELKAQSAYYRYLFVMGHEPAFSTTGVEGKYIGLDFDQEKRDDFWKILKSNNVLAYFCSHEHLYDRSFRDGVWQIISGGGGASLNKKGIVKAFYHALLLHVPTELGQLPEIKVIDIKGNVRDQFTLTPDTDHHPIYQMRISKNDYSSSSDELSYSSTGAPYVGEEGKY